MLPAAERQSIMGAMDTWLMRSGLRGLLHTLFWSVVWPPKAMADQNPNRAWRALAVHVLGWVVGLAFLAPIFLAKGPGGLSFWVSASKLAWSSPVEFALDMLAILFIAGLWNGAYLLAAVMLSPWAACDEKLLATFWRSIRGAWLLSPQFVLGLIAIAMLQRMETPGTIGVVALTLYLPTLALLTIAGEPWGGRCRWPANCRQCGYILIRVGDSHAQCPECGTPIRESLRPGPIGVSAGEANSPPSMGSLRSRMTAIFSPAQFGQQLRILSPQPRLRWLVLEHLLLATFVIHVGFTLLSFQVPSHPNNASDAAITIDKMLDMRIMSVAATFAVLSIGGMAGMATVVGGLASLVYGRNLMAAAGHAVSHLMPLGIAFIGLVLAIYVAMPLLLVDQYLARAMLSTVATLCLVILGLGGMAVAVQTWRIVAAARRSSV